MARLSKTELGDRGRYRFNQKEVELPELQGEDEEVPNVLVRTPSVAQRDTLAKKLPDDEKDWEVKDVSELFAVIVVDPKLDAEEAKSFLGDWPGPALDRIVREWTELTGSEAAMRESAGDFQPPDGQTD